MPGMQKQEQSHVDLHQEIISLQVHYHIKNVCYRHVTLNAVICDNLGKVQLPRTDSSYLPEVTLDVHCECALSPERNSLFETFFCEII